MSASENTPHITVGYYIGNGSDKEKDGSVYLFFAEKDSAQARAFLMRSGLLASNSPPACVSGAGISSDKDYGYFVIPTGLPLDYQDQQCGYHSVYDVLRILAKKCPELESHRHSLSAMGPFDVELCDKQKSALGDIIHHMENPSPTLSFRQQFDLAYAQFNSFIRHAVVNEADRENIGAWRL